MASPIVMAYCSSLVAARQAPELSSISQFPNFISFLLFCMFFFQLLAVMMVLVVALEILKTFLLRELFAFMLWFIQLCRVS